MNYNNVVISQSMLFPWVGLLEQVRLADVFVHYDDVQFSKGSFVNRVQIKTEHGIKWMTVPMVNRHLGQSIDEVECAPAETWRERHFRLLESSFAGAKYAQDAIDIVDHVYSIEYSSIGALARASFLALVKYYGLDKSKTFIDIRDCAIDGKSSERVLRIVRHLRGKNYITGLGGLKYLDHDLFQEYGIGVSYMQYQCCAYPQLHGTFTPYVSGLDLVANCGKDGLQYICSKTIDWRFILNE